jgi:uncharacterized protein (DUF362 family)
MQIFEQKNYSSLSLNLLPDSFWMGFPDVRGATVFVKPNLVNPDTHWDHCSTTRVEVTDLVIQKLLAEKASKIIIGECGFKDQWKATMKSTGYKKLSKKYPKVKIIPLQDGPNFHKFTLKRIPKGSYRSLFGVKFSDYLLASDVIINIPKMKVHTMAGITGAIKNMMGTMTQKGNMHPRASIDILHKRLADLNTLTSKLVDFIVMDGILGAEYAEQSGRPVKSSVLLSGISQWEIDVAAAKLMGFNPRKIPYLKYINSNRSHYDAVEVPSHLVKKYEKPLSWKK